MSALVAPLATSLRSGVPLGATRSGRPVGVQLVRDAPVRVVVLESSWLAALVVVRAAVLGARVVVVTTRPSAWAALTLATGSETAGPAIITPGEPAPAGTVLSPVCVLVDDLDATSETTLARSAWTTSVHLLHGSVAAGSPLVDTADLLLVPPGPGGGADTTLRRLGLPPEVGAQLARAGGSDALLVTRTRALLVTTRPTPTELSLLGRPEGDR